MNNFTIDGSILTYEDAEKYLRVRSTQFSYPGQDNSLEIEFLLQGKYDSDGEIIYYDAVKMTFHEIETRESFIRTISDAIKISSEASELRLSPIDLETLSEYAGSVFSLYSIQK